MTDKITYDKGFTIVELMITIAVGAILLSVALPSFTTSVQNNRMTTQINDLHTSLSMARSEAIKRDNNITVCPSSNGTACAGNWHNGWIIFADSNSDGTVDAGEEILSVHGAIAGNTTLAFSKTNVIYASNGLATSGANGTFTLCDSRGAADAKGLIVGLSGRPRLATDSDSNGILEDGAGTDLVCS